MVTPVLLGAREGSRPGPQEKQRLSFFSDSRSSASPTPAGLGPQAPELLDSVSVTVVVTMTSWLAHVGLDMGVQVHSLLPPEPPETRGEAGRGAWGVGADLGGLARRWKLRALFETLAEGSSIFVNRIIGWKTVLISVFI